MTIWIASGNRENWEVARKHNIWGVPKRSRGFHSRVKKGDTILIYARSETHGRETLPSVIFGEYKVTELFEDTTPLFTAPPQMGNEVFPFRFRLKPVKIFKEPVEIKPLIPELGFITNKTMWSEHFRQAMSEIPEEDYRKIVK
ncbi:EVE domain-containing protein [Methanospirillum sp. J.3.6.1-F.2.7.3]|uniref:EVE domain-containing protein n=1 Tax=Methanospirillum purgamenti TaxID=2834276 RepID=A0A8E7AZU9_9EURY|nr:MULTISPECIES: EVE domain-containing protein [Methanospirillum]MDX8551966.1 EVE domain-containing protein [Methanospirillum hungatei]QVV87858.1 EVE domain-containing protein [Methanospirillum sp. J.3.6.1-F.2.7.3]